MARPKKKRSLLGRILLWMGLLILFIVSLAAGAGLGAWYWITEDLPRIESLADYQPAAVTTVYAADGQVLAEFSLQRRFVVSFSRIPSHVVQAFVSAEDGNFFKHEGLDYLGILRAAIVNLRAGKVVQGGSTITQQVARGLLLTPDRTYVRKIKEMILAQRIESFLSKQEILYLYLNQIYLGHGSYGVQAAAQTYFGKDVDQLNIAEAALLAGLVQAPSRYSPLRHPRRARTRQVYVIGRLLSEGHITSAQAQEARATELKLSLHRKPTVDAPYYRETVRQWLQDKFGEKMLYQSGLKVYTACDPKLTEMAQKAVAAGLAELTKRQGYRGPEATLTPAQLKELLRKPQGEKKLHQGEITTAVVVARSRRAKAYFLRLGGQRGRLAYADVDWARRRPPSKQDEKATWRRVERILRRGDVVKVRLTQYVARGRYWRLELVQEPVAQAAVLVLEAGSGRVRVLLGGRDFGQSQYNRALQAHRQPGSAFKPFIYAAALDHPSKGYTPVSIIVDSPVVYDDPSNPGKKWKPKNYENRFFGPTTFRTGLEHSRNVVTVKILADLGLKYALEYCRKFAFDSKLEPNLSIGLGSASLTLLEMTRGFSVFANGGNLVPAVLVEKVEDRTGKVIYQARPESKQVLSAQSAFLMTHLLKGVMERGTGKTVRVPGWPMAGKTGTTNDLRDAWFLGYTPQLITGVWVGQDDNLPLGRKETGARAAGPIWKSFMTMALKGLPPKDFPVPPGVSFARIDPSTGKSLPPGQTGGFFEAFIQGSEPKPGKPRQAAVKKESDPQKFLQDQSF